MKSSDPVKVYSFSLPPKLVEQLSEVAQSMDCTRSAMLANVLEEALPVLIEIARAVKQYKAGKMAPNVLLASMTRSMASPLFEAQMSMASALEGAGEGADRAHGTRSAPGMSEPESGPYLRNRNKSGQAEQKITKTRKKADGGRRG
jgi:hypothetical protein